MADVRRIYGVQTVHCWAAGQCLTSLSKFVIGARVEMVLGICSAMLLDSLVSALVSTASLLIFPRLDILFCYPEKQGAVISASYGHP